MNRSKDDGCQGASFSGAVKHLFRHLHEAHIVRRNPLVKHFFEDPAGDALAGTSERVALERIHELVRQAAQYYRSTDLSAGNDERARRHHAIVVFHCLKQRPIGEVAASLGISGRQCYRERAEIYSRVARYIGEHDQRRALDYLLEVDEFDLSISRTLFRASFGDSKTAFFECDQLVSSASSVQQRVAALRTSALVSMRFGDSERAEETYASAQLLCTNIPTADPPTADWGVVPACTELIGAKLAHHRGDAAAELRMSQSATSRLERLHTHARVYVRELYVESLYELGVALVNLGNLEKAHEIITRAEAGISQVPIAGFELRTRIASAAWKLRNHLLMNASTWYPARERLQGLDVAFQEAYASRLFVEAAVALVALTEYHAFAGNADEALRTARYAILVAGQQSSNLLQVQTSIQVAMLLLSTKHSNYAWSLLTDMHVENCDVYCRDLVPFCAARRALWLNNFEAAWTLANDSRDSAKQPTLTVSERLVAASAAHRLARTRTARRLIESAIPVAETLGSAPILRDTYAVAAKILREPRLQRQASEISRLLTA